MSRLPRVGGNVQTGRYVPGSLRADDRPAVSHPTPHWRAVCIVGCICLLGLAGLTLLTIPPSIFVVLALWGLLWGMRCFWRAQFAMRVLHAEGAV